MPDIFLKQTGNKRTKKEKGTLQSDYRLVLTWLQNTSKETVQQEMHSGKRYTSSVKTDCKNCCSLPLLPMNFLGNLCVCVSECVKCVGPAVESFPTVRAHSLLPPLRTTIDYDWQLLLCLLLNSTVWGREEWGDSLHRMPWNNYHRA